LNVHCRYKRVHHEMSNGQVSSLYIKEERVRTLFSNKEDENFTAYIVGFVISGKRRDNNNWYNRKKDSKIKLKQTGSCGLEGLIFALNEIKKLQKQIKIGEYIVVFFSDEKRRSAYRYLLRIGFEWGEYGSEKCYFYKKQEELVW
jgi:hypothetical protein